jgi:ethanolamine utilization cobalamin adenosyltransferase
MFSCIFFNIEISKNIPNLYFKDISEILYFYSNIVYSDSDIINKSIAYMNVTDTIIWHYSILIIGKLETLNVDKIIFIWLTFKNIFLLFILNSFSISSFLYFYKNKGLRNVL